MLSLDLDRVIRAAVAMAAQSKSARMPTGETLLGNSLDALSR